MAQPTTRLGHWCISHTWLRHTPHSCSSCLKSHPCPGRHTSFLVKGGFPSSRPAQTDCAGWPSPSHLDCIEMVQDDGRMNRTTRRIWTDEWDGMRRHDSLGELCLPTHFSREAGCVSPVSCAPTRFPSMRSAEGSKTGCSTRYVAHCVLLLLLYRAPSPGIERERTPAWWSCSPPWSK